MPYGNVILRCKITGMHKCIPYAWIYDGKPTKEYDYMKGKIIGIVVDILLFAVVFSAADLVAQQLFHSKNFWLEFGIYIVFYAIVFGCKKGIVCLWKQSAAKDKENS